MEKIRFKGNKGSMDGSVDRNIIGELVNQEAGDNNPKTTKSSVDVDPNTPAAKLLKTVLEAKKRRPKFD